MTLYWQDRLKVIVHLFANPVFANSMETTPYQLFDPEENVQAYSEFMSGEFAWEYHVCFHLSFMPWGRTNNAVVFYSCGAYLTGCHWRIGQDSFDDRYWQQGNASGIAIPHKHQCRSPNEGHSSCFRSRCVLTDPKVSQCLRTTSGHPCSLRLSHLS